MFDDQLITLKSELLKLAEDMKAKHIELGMKASGKWLNSLRTEVEALDSGIIGRIYAENYTEQLVYGREQGKFPPINAIEKWIDDKPISFNENEISKKSLAFLIARSIAEKGTRYYQQGGTDLTDAVLTDEAINEIVNKIGNAYLEHVTRLLNKQLEVV